MDTPDLTSFSEVLKPSVLFPRARVAMCLASLAAGFYYQLKSSVNQKYDDDLHQGPRQSNHYCLVMLELQSHCSLLLSREELDYSLYTHLLQQEIFQLPVTYVMRKYFSDRLCVACCGACVNYALCLPLEWYI
jgi:hypothetical protein